MFLLLRHEFHQKCWALSFIMVKIEFWWVTIKIWIQHSVSNEFFSTTIADEWKLICTKLFNTMIPIFLSCWVIHLTTSIIEKYIFNDYSCAKKVHLNSIAPSAQNTYKALFGKFKMSLNILIDMVITPRDSELLLYSYIDDPKRPCLPPMKIENLMLFRSLLLHLKEEKK